MPKDPYPGAEDRVRRARAELDKALAQRAASDAVMGIYRCEFCHEYIVEKQDDRCGICVEAG